MNTESLSLDELQREGMKVLIDNLGLAGTIRFLQQSTKTIGEGDYTAERHQWLKDVTIEELVAEAHRPRAEEVQAPSEVSVD